MLEFEVFAKFGKESGGMQFRVFCQKDYPIWSQCPFEKADQQRVGLAVVHHFGSEDHLVLGGQDGGIPVESPDVRIADAVEQCVGPGKRRASSLTSVMVTR